MRKTLILSFFIFFNTHSFASKNIILGTGEINGTYYPIGKNICKILNNKLKNIRCSIESTDGSVYNINAINKEEFNFAISQADTLYNAINGIKNFKEKKIVNLRSIMAIYPELLTFVVNKSSKIKSIEDIKNKKINVGNPNSGSEATTLEILKEYNIKREDLKLAGSLKAADTADALRDERIDGYFFMVGHPAKNIKDAANSIPISIVDIKGEKVEKLVEKNPYLKKSFIPASLYKGVNKKVETFGVKAVLITRTDVSEKLVYKFLKTIFENFEEFKKAHVVFKDLTKESMIKGLGIPLHKGAKKYFKEINLLEKGK